MLQIYHQKKLNTGLKNIELNQENKQPWSENGRNTSLVSFRLILRIILEKGLVLTYLLRYQLVTTQDPHIITRFGI